MTDVLNSELLKLRSVRSTTYVLLAIAASLLAGALISYLMTADWDTSPPDLRQKFGAADPGVMVVPFGQFCLGVLGALAITSEYGSGMIRTALVSVPRRKAYLLAKTLVVAGVSLVVALVTSFLAYQAGELITGDRPRPISAYDSLGDAVPTLSANTASLVLLALVGLGLGFLLRSTAGALVTLCGLLFVLPALTLLLPHPWNDRAYSVMLPTLAPQLSGELPDAPLSPLGAGLVMLAYLVLALGAGATALLRRDA
ncbi:ABC transporter permease [Saccharothrix sp. ALI-22-I]|uniref:ABC transporter permease n=1 Tax=Saccharothrix sp. ALI-22-I TaxID=1933778 RepID=UPI00097C82B9|nr:ABC transporter permease [Saccharothrix sp. ALI-22-I]ONI84981.1 ABC transporter permease [Saccharothrix sp. ALI-22-I]